MKLPKQWRYWCKMAGLRPVSRPRSAWSWYTLKGHGCFWRVNCLDQFQVSLPYHDFDRWANSAMCTLPLPENEAQFAEAFINLLQQASKPGVK